MRVVYDGLAKLKPDDVSINDCLDQGPNYVPKLFDVLVKFRSHQRCVDSGYRKSVFDGRYK